LRAAHVEAPGGEAEVAESGRCFLFLQGLAARFFEYLGQALAARGHAVHRVNFNGGDRAFWRLPGAVDFRGRAEEWPSFLEGFVAAAGVSDIILFGDCRPLHRAAIAVARSQRRPVWVVEEGYLRPDWITFEQSGVNGYSALPRDPRWYRDAARRLPAWHDPPPLASSFRRRATEDVAYWLASAIATRRFPHFATHRPYFQLVEYAGWLRRLALRRRAGRRAAGAITSLADCRDPIFLFPLQLDCDYQLRVHSPFQSVRAAIETVLTSFAGHAEAGSRLIVKLHPLDSGIYDWTAMTRHAAVARGLSDRLTILDGGAIDAALALSRGVVTINSTVGIEALTQGRAVIALGSAIYDMPGLTFQGSLDEFWSAGRPPDPTLLDAFRRVLAARVLIPGSFFSKRGLKVAVDAAVDRLEAAASPARDWASRQTLAAE
jgi:capsular polysaccharide export protein